MSQAAEASQLWIGHEGPAAARERVRRSVGGLIRARRLQVLVDHVSGGLLAGLSLATIAVILARWLGAALPLWKLAGAIIVTALLVAIALGWLRRPDAMTVAIHADLALRLKQRLSTAWEFMGASADSELTDRLALQAVKAGLPARPGAVFPLRVNRCGWMAPLAAMALLLVAIVDFEPARAPAARMVDEQVVGEGQRLSAFGREMQRRALRDKLPRSTRQAERLEQLGARMESGGLDREQALGQLALLGESLSEDRRQALADAKGAGPGSGSSPGARGAALPAEVDPGAMLDRMRRGALGSDDLGALERHMEELERSGVAPRELKNALDRNRVGADEALREILERLAALDRALKEDKQLREALEQVRRSQENLGDPRATANASSNAALGIDWDGDERTEPGAQGTPTARTEGGTDSPRLGRSSRSASQANSSMAAERLDSPLEPQADASGRVLRPQGQIRDGEEFSTQGRMLPRTNRPGVENVEMPQEFAAQVESVLAREDYPAHYKDFIRKYFLHLNQGARDAAEPAPARGAQP